MRKLVLGLAPLFALAVIAAWSTCRVVGAGAGVPGDAAWAEAAALVRAERQPGDLIVFAPRWIDPVGRLHLGDVIPVAMAARLDRERYGRVWELSIRGARAPEGRGLAVEWSRTIGGVQVQRYAHEAAPVVTDVLELPPPAVLGLVQSPPQLVLAEVGFEPHRCWQVIPSAGQTVTLRWEGVRLGSELAIGLGLADVFKRRDVRAPADVVVEVGEREVARARLRNEGGWVRRVVETTPGTTTLAVRVSAIGPRSADRLVCFAIEARR